MKKIIPFILIFVFCTSIAYGKLGIYNPNSISFSEKTAFSKYYDYGKGNNLITSSLILKPNTYPDIYSSQGTGAAVFGFVSAPIVLALSIASAATSDYTIPSLPLGATAWLLAAVSTPIIGGSIDFSGLSGGTTALYVVSWVAYGITIAEGAALIALGATDTHVPAMLIFSTGLLGTVSILGMSACNLQAKTAWKPEKNRRLNIAFAPAYKGAVGGFTYRF